MSSLASHQPAATAPPAGPPAADPAAHPALGGLPAMWLRDNCPCRSCRDPRTGQRLVAVGDLPAGVTVAAVTETGGGLEVVFGPDGHRATFDRTWLALYAGPAGPLPGAPPADPRTEDATTSLSATRPMIGLDPCGRIREVRFSTRSLQPVRLAPAGAAAFYGAYRAFAAVIGRPASQVLFRLDAGDCLILDNTRILRARTAFTGGGPRSRHLQGCYADLDGLASALAVAGRGDGGPA